MDDFLGEAKPDDKLRLIRDHQDEGYMVAMTGDGTNDAPALAQADVAVAMNNGTQPAREAANIIDLDSRPDQAPGYRGDRQADPDDPGALTTFSIANDIARVLRHHPGRARRDLPAARGPERHGALRRPDRPSSPRSSSTRWSYRS